MRCDKAHTVSDKSQYQEATLIEKLILKLHLIYCGVCKKYSKKNTILTKKINESNVKCLDKKSKETMRKDLDKAINETPI